MKRKWDSEDAEAQRECINEVITRIDEIGDSSAGIIAAQEIIDIVTEHLAPGIYNKGVRDVKKQMIAKHADIEIDIDTLELHG